MRFRDLGGKYFDGRHPSPTQSSFLTFVCFLIQIATVHFNKTITRAFINKSAALMLLLSVTS